MVVSWICLLLVAGVFTSVNGDCPPSHLAADYIPYTLKFNISMETTYDILYGGYGYKEEFQRYFNLNHSRISSEDADRIKHCLSFNNLTLLTRNGSLMINDQSKPNISYSFPVFGNMTFTMHRSLPLQYKEHEDSKWYTSKDAALEVILCGNGDRFTSNVTAYTKLTIPDGGLFVHAGGDNLIYPFVTNHPFSYDVDCCRLEVKLVFTLLQDFVDEKYSDIPPPLYLEQMEIPDHE